MCKAYSIVTHIKQQKYFHHLKHLGYNTEFLLYPRPFRWWKYFCFFYIYICSFSTKFTLRVFLVLVSILTSSPLLSCHSGSATVEIWRHIDFSRWRPQSLNTTSSFVFVDVLAYRRSKSINKPNFVDINGQHNIISIYGWDIWLRYNDYWFGKTNVHHLSVLISTIFP